MYKAGIYSAVFLAFLFILTSCVNGPANPAEEPQVGPDIPPGEGRGPGMMGRHHASIPEEYLGIDNLVAADQDSLGRGQALYVQHCVSCHGETGMGEGAAGVALDPAPSPIAHTSLMLGDGYLFWRISEGGLPFETAMPGWKATLTENERWDVINYIQAIGREGESSIAEIQAQRQQAMLQEAVTRGIIDESEAQTFSLVHDALEAYMKSHSGLEGNLDAREDAALNMLVSQGEFTEDQRQVFQDVHDRLAENGLMP